MVIAGVGVCHRWKHLTDPTYCVLDVKRAQMPLVLIARVAMRTEGSGLDVRAELAVLRAELAKPYKLNLYLHTYNTD